MFSNVMDHGAIKVSYCGMTIRLGHKKVPKIVVNKEQLFLLLPQHTITIYTKEKGWQMVRDILGEMSQRCNESE